MKKHLSIVLTLALVAVLLPVAFAQSSSPSAAPQTDQSSPSAAQSPSSQSPSAQSPSTQSPSTTSPSSGSASSSAESSEGTSFSGTVVKSGAKYVLKTDTGSTYQIDDQEKAKQFEGKQVKVSGSLDKTTSMLHVTDISPAESR